MGCGCLGERSRFVSRYLRCFLLFRSRPDHTTVLVVMVAQTAVGRETWDPYRPDLTRMAGAAGGRSVALAAYGPCPFRFEVRSKLHRQRRLQSLLVPKRDTTDPLAHKRLEFDTFLELGSVHALQVETFDLKWHEVVHRVLTGRVSGRNLSLDRCRQSRRHVDDRSSLCFVGLRVAAYALRAVGLRFVRGQGDEFVAGSQV